MISVAGQDHDRELRDFFGYLSNHAESRLIGQAQVEDYGIHRLLQQKPEALFQGIYPLRQVNALGFRKHFLDQAGIARIVFDE